MQKPMPGGMAREWRREPPLLLDDAVLGLLQRNFGVVDEPSDPSRAASASIKALEPHALACLARIEPQCGTRDQNSLPSSQF
jgi:hypothetical protein